ncbi:MAG TPA: dihydrodipicolinate synthase family protein [Verrucomicrobiae bacterium]|nr:dihydrodipicolinate synthase family protein [Verrucomicrobiae bacterium]
MLFSLQGIIPAVWTPTDADGKLLEAGFRRNIETMIAAGVDSLLVLGSTGEFIHLTADQRKEVLETALQFAGKTPVLANISDINPRVVAELGRHAKSVGAAGVSLLPPWFYPMNEDDLVAFFVAAGKAINLPLTLYNFHAMTGKRITPEIVRRIGSEIQIGGIKHSAGDLEEHREFAAIGAELGFNVVTGWDTHLPEAMALGAKGCVAGLANVVPELIVKVYQAVASGRSEDVHEPARQMRKIGEIISALEFPFNVAAAMEARGREVGVSKSIMSSQTRVRYAALKESMRALLNEYGVAA